jgi:FAD/FMN-containing dehydrogenase
MRRTLSDAGANLLNASVRVVHREDNFLTYAPTDAFAIVLYLNQTTDREGNERMGKLTRDLIDLCAAHGGRFFLPYQLHYTAEQLQRSYPEIGEFFKAKRELDPTLVFSNTFYEKYSAMAITSAEG